MGQSADLLPLSQTVCAALPKPLPCFFVSLPLAYQGPHSLTLQAQAEALYQHMLRTSVSHWHVVGYSLGGRLAQALVYDVLRYQKKLHVASLSLLAAHPGLPAADGIARGARIAQDRQLSLRLQLLKTPEQWRVFFDAFWYALPLFGALKQHRDYPLLLSRRTMYRRPEEGERWAAFLQASSSGEQRDYRADLTTSLFPVLYLAGEQDQKYAALGAQLQAQARTRESHFNFLCLSEAAHMLYFEQPALCAQAIQAHLFQALSRLGHELI